MKDHVLVSLSTQGTSFDLFDAEYVHNDLRMPGMVYYPQLYSVDQVVAW